MRGLPTPPDAYWAQVPWWAYIGFLTVSLLIVVVIGPWCIQRARNHPSAMLSREQTLKMREDAYQLRQDLELEATKKDRDHGWDLARGWVAVAHQCWHDQVNAVQRYNSLLELCKRVADGRLTLEAMRDRLADQRAMREPKPLPSANAVEPKKPGETTYA